ncbi:hypothetical protein VF11_15335 [Nostoc linckia z14]|nr:hypothetical protein VF11_15335 [Nostoc linckia z14]
MPIRLTFSISDRNAQGKRIQGDEAIWFGERGKGKGKGEKGKGERGKGKGERGKGKGERGKGFYLPLPLNTLPFSHLYP